MTENAALNVLCEDVTERLAALQGKHNRVKAERTRMIASGDALFTEINRLNEELHARDIVIEALQRELDDREAQGAQGQ